MNIVSVSSKFIATFDYSSATVRALGSFFSVACFSFLDYASESASDLELDMNSDFYWKLELLPFISESFCVNKELPVS